MSQEIRPGTRIEMDGTLNLRDLGGWKTLDGNIVANGVLFRSDKLSELTDADHQRFEALGIRTVIDLRYDTELEADPSRLWAGIDDHVHLPIAGELAQLRSFIDRLLDGEYQEITAEWIGDSYLEMLEHYPHRFGEAAERAIEGAPTLFHCTAGKDRTGLLAMLLLSAAGVDDEDILLDYTLTNGYRSEARIAALKPRFVERGLDIERFRPALSAPRVALEQAISWLNEHHRSPAGYLADAAGLGDEGLRAIRAALVRPPD